MFFVGNSTDAAWGFPAGVHPIRPRGCCGEVAEWLAVPGLPQHYSNSLRLPVAWSLWAVSSWVSLSSNRARGDEGIKQKVWALCFIGCCSGEGESWTFSVCLLHLPSCASVRDLGLLFPSWGKSSYPGDSWKQYVSGFLWFVLVA